MTNKEPTNLDQLPITGRIGRLVKILKTEADENKCIEILKNASEYKLLSAEDKSAWWKNAIEKMQNELGEDKAIQIIKICGSKCCGKGQRATAKRLYTEAGTVQKFLEKISKYEVREGELNYILENEHTIIAEHNKCFCKQVANSKEKFDNTIYCQCSVEFNKQFFTAALGMEVDVQLIQSIICGAKSCKFRITF